MSEKDNQNSHDGDIENVDEIEVIEAEIVDDDEQPAMIEPEKQTLNKSGYGFGALLIAGLIGSVATVALTAGVGYYTLQSNGLDLFNDDSNNVAEERYTMLSTRLLSLEGVIETQQDVEPEAIDLSPIADKISALDIKITNIGAVQQKVIEQAGRIDDLDVKLATAAKVWADAAQISDASGNIDLGVIAAMKRQIEALQQRPVNTQNLEQDDQQNAMIAALDQQLKDIEEKIKALKNTVTPSNVVFENGQSASNMASALAVASLERALQDETPFEVELKAIKSFTKDSEALDKLSSYAKNGLVSELNLLGQFDDLLEAALVADLKGEGKGIFDKFVANAKSIISIRRTGNIEGDDIEAILARMEVAVNAKDLSKAVAQGKQLTGPAKAVFEKWMGLATSRLAAKDLMRQLSSDILTSLGKQ